MRNYAPMVDAGRELAQAFAMQPAIEQQAAGNSIANSMQAALAQAKINKYKSETDLNTKQLQGIDEGRDLFMQGATGLDQDKISQLASALTEGWKTQAAGPPTPDGQFPQMKTTAPNWATPQVADRFNQARVAMGANMAGTGKTNGEQLVNAMQGAINIGRQDQMIAGKANPNDIAAAMAATAGKPTVDVTSSGIGFNPYGDQNNLNTQPFEQANAVKAKATVDAALARVNANGNQLPAEAKLVQFYTSIGYPKEQAVEMARSRKNQPLRDLAADLYGQYQESMLLDPNASNMSEEERDLLVEQQVTKTLDFLKRNEDQFGGQDSPPVNGAKKAPDGKWYLLKDGRYHRVDQ